MDGHRGPPEGGTAAESPSRAWYDAGRQGFVAGAEGPFGM